jgi:hypothetical protein
MDGMDNVDKMDGAAQQQDVGAASAPVQESAASAPVSEESGLRALSNAMWGNASQPAQPAPQEEPAPAPQEQPAVAAVTPAATPSPGEDKLVQVWRNWVKESELTPEALHFRQVASELQSRLDQALAQQQRQPQQHFAGQGGATPPAQPPVAPSASGAAGIPALPEPDYSAFADFGIEPAAIQQAVQLEAQKMTAPLMAQVQALQAQLQTLQPALQPLVQQNVEQEIRAQALPYLDQFLTPEIRQRTGITPEVAYDALEQQRQDLVRQGVPFNQVYDNAYSHQLLTQIILSHAAVQPQQTAQPAAQPAASQQQQRYTPQSFIPAVPSRSTAGTSPAPSTQFRGANGRFAAPPSDNARALQILGQR